LSIVTSIYYHLLASPVGPFLVAGSEQALHYTGFEQGQQQRYCRDTWIRDAAPLRYAIEPLEAYFDGQVLEFDIPLALAGTAFQRSAWAALQTIPYGQTASYGDIARKIGHPGASRAVGPANHANPIPIIVPCHRVIGTDGSLTGFGGGLAAKTTLLQLESAQVCGGQPSLF